MKNPDLSKKNLAGTFGPLLDRLREVNQRFRPGRPFEWPEHAYMVRPLAMRKADRRRVNKAAKQARKNNRRG